jgi:putative DNA methylase
MTDDTPPQPELFPDAAKQTRPAAPAAAPDGAHRPPNLGEPVRVKVPDFNDPNRPKTCLEVDFPILPINELSRLEGNAGKPIYQMSKWWARRRSCVFRALLLAAAIEAPRRRLPDGSSEVNADEAQKAVWDVYYANHQRAGNFKHLKVLDCFMGGGTTLVEGSRLGFQVAGVDLNPVAWFIVKNELACPDPDAVQTLFDRIEAEVKPQLQPFYVTDCPRGHKGTWFDTRTGKKVDIDPIPLPPDQRCHYRYEGPEVIYTFWAKHGPCLRQHQHGGSHRTPVFRTPVIAEKKLGVKYLALTCKKCKTAFHAELGSARMAPGAERVVLPGEAPFSELSQPFAALVADYDKGRQEERKVRIDKLATLVDSEPGLKCPRCGAFAGE